jgi:hypothetical protein
MGMEIDYGKVWEILPFCPISILSDAPAIIPAQI